LITLEDFASRHEEWIKICLYFGADIERSCEIVQQMYLKIGEMYVKNGNLDRMTNYDGKINTVYVFKVLHSLFIDNAKQKPTIVIDVIIAETDYNEIADDCHQVMIGKIKQCIDKMSDYDKMLVELYFVHDKSIREISKQTGIGVHSIFNSIKNAKEKIKKECGNDYRNYTDAGNHSQTVYWSRRYSAEDNEEDRY
jgi:Sigma-70, region 4